MRQMGAALGTARPQLGTGAMGCSGAPYLQGLEAIMAPLLLIKGIPELLAPAVSAGHAVRA